jgi:hypothetical protein
VAAVAADEVEREGAEDYREREAVVPVGTVVGVEAHAGRHLASATPETRQ